MLSMARPVGRRGQAILTSIILATFVAACGGAASLGPAAAPRAATPGSNDAAGGTGTGGEANPPANDKNALYSVGQPDLLIIKTGTMVLQVTGIDAALTAATQRITALGGYASGSDRSGDGESAQATITFRIPAARWDEALVGLRGLATKVLAEQSQTEDVTGQVVDLGARITNLQATERALQGIMDRATEIKDVLAVQTELTNVRGQIEELTAQKTHLEAQAAYSTLSVTFSLKPDPVLTSSQQFDPKNEVDQASASLVGVLQAIATAGIWFAIVWLPILLALAIIVGIGLFVARRLRRSVGAPTAPAVPAEPGA
jgi:hypothetical protein